MSYAGAIRAVAAGLVLVAPWAPVRALAQEQHPDTILQVLIPGVRLRMSEAKLRELLPEARRQGHEAERAASHGAERERGAAGPPSPSLGFYHLKGLSVLGLEPCGASFRFLAGELGMVSFDCGRDVDAAAALEKQLGPSTLEAAGAAYWISATTTVSLNVRAQTFGVIDREVERAMLAAAMNQEQTRERATSSAGGAPVDSDEGSDGGRSGAAGPSEVDSAKREPRKE